MRGGAVLLGVAVLAALSGTARADDRSSLNVVVIDICSARADHFGAYGYGRDTTPEMDALAKEGVLFEQAIAQSSWCLPNYATLFTGHTPEVHGQYVNIPFRQLPAFETTVAERMKEAGYETGAFSGGVYMMPAWGLQRGFDTFVNRYSTATGTADRLADLAPGIRDWVRGTKGAFFLYVAVDDLHAPYQSDDPDRYDKTYQGIARDTDTLTVAFGRAYNGEPLRAESPLIPKLAAFRADPGALPHLAARYDASLHSTDHEIGRLIAALKHEHLWDNTVVIVTADHGEMLGEHGLLGHTEGLYEGVLHVPLIVHHPGFPQSRGRRVASQVRRIDLAPTLLEIGRARADDLELQGLSLVPLLRDPSLSLRDASYASSKGNRAALSDTLIDERVVRTSRWKLLWYLRRDRFELYDLRADPGERRNVAAENPDVVAALAKLLLDETERARPHGSGLPESGAPTPDRPFHFNGNAR